MAGVVTFMQVTAVDSEKNLFRIEHVFPQELVAKVLATPWLELDWCRQEGQEGWARRRIQDTAIPWINEWHLHLSQVWHTIGEQIGVELQPYQGTAFWLDEPGFCCAMHTDGELPGSLHLTWVGPGTTFYWHKDPDTVRYQVPEQPNCGYIMVNQPDSTGYRRLLWHAMLAPVESTSFRLTTYSWITPK
jgi:hypothetical protein